MRAAFWLYLLTGLRRSELLNAKWQDVDWNRQELSVPVTKSGRPHYVPLCSDAVRRLKEIPRVLGNPYIIPGAKNGGRAYDLKKPWARILERAKIEDLKLHDLRRTVGSWLAQSGHSLHLIGRVLNHTSPSTTAVYARFAQTNVRDALEKHGRLLMDTVSSSTIEGRKKA